MAAKDRRSGSDRRETERYVVSIDIEWESSSGRKPGTISDISFQGCFILSSGEVEDGESVKILFPLSDGMKVQFLGRVVNHVFEIGFAVNFVDVSEAQRDFLQKLINQNAKR